MRDDFSSKTKDALARRAGMRCSNPACRRLTNGPASTPQNYVSIGVAAHITAAAPGGPRYDPTLRADQRSSIGNGIWLDEACAKRIDSDVERYPARLLQGWKAAAEEAALADLAQENWGVEDAPYDIELEFFVAATVGNEKEVSQSFQMRTPLPAIAKVSDLVERAKFQRGIEASKAKTGGPPQSFSLSRISDPTMFDWNLAELPYDVCVSKVHGRRIVIAVFDPAPGWPAKKVAIHTKMAIEENLVLSEF